MMMMADLGPTNSAEILFGLRDYSDGTVNLKSGLFFAVIDRIKCNVTGIGTNTLNPTYTDIEDLNASLIRPESLLLRSMKNL